MIEAETVTVPESNGMYHDFEGKKILTFPGALPGYKPGTLWLCTGAPDQVCPQRQFDINGTKPGTLPGQTTPGCQSTLG